MHSSARLKMDVHHRGLSLEGEQNAKRIIYIGGKKDLYDELGGYGYSILSFNLSFPADVWLKYNALANADLPDAIVCDLELPDTDAFSLFESLKVNDRLKYIPFIVIAKKFNTIDKIKAFELGIDDFYHIDVSGEDLSNRIAILKEIKKEKAGKAAPPDTVVLSRPFKIHWTKRLFDVVFSTAALILASPLMALIALLVKLESKGPVFYVSKRVGTGYQIFDFYKFRTMLKDADIKLESLMHLNQYVSEQSRPSFFKLDNDPRATKLGRFLRRTRLDELPQLINVLKGDMSIVGNRPLPLYEAENLTTDLWAKRFLAPAGITGLWQVAHEHSEKLSERERKELDVAYADKASFWFDMKIIVKTIPEVFTFLKNNRLFR